MRICSSRAQPITRLEHPSHTAAPKYSQPSGAQIGDIRGPYPVQLTGVERFTRSLGTGESRSMNGVAGANVRGLIPARHWRRNEAATVLRDTCTPAARRSARMRGAR